MRLSFLFGLLACLGSPAQASAVIDCPKPLEQLATNVSTRIRSDVSPLSVTSARDFDARAQIVTQDLFHRYSDSGTVALAHSMISIFCQVIASSSLSDAEKLDHLYRLEEWVTRISGRSAPTNAYSKATCRVDAAAVLKPIRAVFEAWSNRDIDKYMAQWAPSSIQRSKYYARERKEIFKRRREDFSRFSSVSVISIHPNISFADGAKARVSNIYSMRFVLVTGRVLSEMDVSESYILECSAQGDRWLIRENNDYALTF